MRSFSVFAGRKDRELALCLQKNNISKFQFDLDYCQALYHEPLARMIAQALPVFDIKFTFTFISLTPYLQILVYNASAFLLLAM